MTTSRETDTLDHAALRKLVDHASALTHADRVTLLKGLIPAVAREMAPREFEGLIVELQLKGQRFYDASLHPGQGRAARHVLGERDVEGR
jgi:hypothetical protein